MKIIIFDDRIEDALYLEKIITKFFSKYNINFKIFLYQKENDLIKNIEKTDFLFLDMETKASSGLEIGKYLRKQKIPCHIIITTQYSKYAIDGYSIYADRYFLKPIQYEQFAIEMKPILNKYFNQHLGFYDKKISPIKIFYKNILYIAYNNRKTEIHYINNHIDRTSYSLAYWLNKLNESTFSQTHKAYIVNMQYISAFEKNNIILFNGEKIPLSRYYKYTFEKTYNLYLHENI